MEWHTYRLSMSVDVDITASVANERFKRRLANSVRGGFSPAWAWPHTSDDNSLGVWIKSSHISHQPHTYITILLVLSTFCALFSLVAFMHADILLAAPVALATLSITCNGNLFSFSCRPAISACSQARVDNRSPSSLPLLLFPMLM
jgi:hypothetical protein